MWPLRMIGTLAQPLKIITTEFHRVLHGERLNELITPCYFSVNSFVFLGDEDISFPGLCKSGILPWFIT